MCSETGDQSFIEHFSKTILFFLLQKEKNGFGLPRKERGQGANRCPEFGSKILDSSCPSRSSLPSERSLRSAHRLSAELRHKIGK